MTASCWAPSKKCLSINAREREHACCVSIRSLWTYAAPSSHSPSLYPFVSLSLERFCLLAAYDKMQKFHPYYLFQNKWLFEGNGMVQCPAQGVYCLALFLLGVEYRMRNWTLLDLSMRGPIIEQKCKLHSERMEWVPAKWWVRAIEPIMRMVISPCRQNKQITWP